MWRFSVDEDIPRSTAPMLRQEGYEAEDVRDVGLRGHSDRSLTTLKNRGLFLSRPIRADILST